MWASQVNRFIVTIKFYSLHEILEQAKLMYGNRRQVRDPQGAWETLLE